MEGFMEVELMVTKPDDDDDRVNIEQSASGRWTGRVLQYQKYKNIEIQKYPTCPTHHTLKI